MAFAAVKRATLLYPCGGTLQNPNHHLFILLTDPVGPAKQVLMVNVSTIRGERYDSTCVLDARDHPFLRRPSYVVYAASRTEPVSRLMNGIAAGEFIAHELLKEEVFARVVAGIEKSPHTRPFAKTFLKESN